ncbi:MAG: cysteine desulfurase [Chloroflexi bacterium]|nr:cysteine desulfurase [Chloroflexota bacterium]MCI0578259.1 cysteine desulfurase [Chloroflexota bacterium]MCI0643504.1 cysteine desulfurase [Chloroflexota bacterium]MCI0726612.1 cysteine desulfurase [Chloroflexota bacterium]
MTRRIYLDHGASTPVDPHVIEAMLPYWTEQYGNPASVHTFGRQASAGLEKARRTIAGLLNARPDEIIFTGCGSESDNLALRGVMWAARAGGRGNHLITSAIEHKAVLDTAGQLRDHFGFDLTILPVDENGQVSLEEVEAAIRPDTVLITIMAANNEIGAFQPFEAIGQIAHEHGVLFHTDAIQAAAVTTWDMETMPIDLFSLAPHKFYGPKGVGVLCARQGVELVAALTGGGQEDGRRAGTVNVAYAVGAAEAFRLAMEHREENVAHYQALTRRLIGGLTAAMPGDCILTGHPAERLPQNASFAFRHVNGNDLLIHLDMAGIAASSGSACKTGDPKPSAILEALGLSPEWTKGGLRLTVGRQNSLEDIDYVIEVVPGIVNTVKQFSLQFA